jgi:hypothetical protein
MVGKFSSTHHHHCHCLHHFCCLRFTAVKLHVTVFWVLALLQYGCVWRKVLSLAMWQLAKYIPSHGCCHLFSCLILGCTVQGVLEGICCTWENFLQLKLRMCYQKWLYPKLIIYGDECEISFKESELLYIYWLSNRY